MVVIFEWHSRRSVPDKFAPSSEERKTSRNLGAGLGEEKKEEKEVAGSFEKFLQTDEIYLLSSNHETALLFLVVTMGCPRGILTLLNFATTNSIH